MKRYLCAVLALLLCLPLAACGKTVPTPTEINATTIKIAMLCTTSRSAKYAEGLYYGEEAIRACKAMGLSSDHLSIKTGLSEDDANAVKKAAVSYIRQGYTHIIGTAPGYADTLRALAEKYPKVTFLQNGDTDGAPENYHGFRVRTYQGAYLCGVTAALQSKSGSLGVVAPQTAENPEMCALINAFTLGAQAVNDAARVSVVFTDAAIDRAAETAAAEKLLAASCDVLLQLTKTSAAAKVAEKAEVPVCGVYTILSDTVDTALYGVMPRLADYLTQSLQSILDQQPLSADFAFLGYVDGALTTANGISTDLDGSTQPLLNTVTERLQTSKWDVFGSTALMRDNDTFTEVPALVTDTAGNERITADAPLSDRDILSMNWLANGVTVL